MEKRGPLTIWSVDGSYVCKNIDEEFISEIPRGEVWIDVETDPDEQRFFVHHALVERRMMLKGADYDTARQRASKEERQMRVAAGDLRKVIRG